MAATRTLPAPTPRTAEPAPVLDRFYNVRAAAIRLGLTDPTIPDDTTGQSWLRDGFNRPESGAEGRKFPGFYMSRQLMFSESDLAVITEIAREESEARQRAKDTPLVSTGRPRRLRSKSPVLAGS